MAATGMLTARAMTTVRLRPGVDFFGGGGVADGVVVGGPV